MADSQLLEIGRLGRAHGIRGEIFVSLTSDRIERLAEGSTLETEGEWLTVVSSRRSGNRFIVRFAEIDSRNDAERMTGRVLRAQPLDDPDALWVHEMIGAQVVEVGGRERGEMRRRHREPGFRSSRARLGRSRSFGVRRGIERRDHCHRPTRWVVRTGVR